jgi:geranyl-CoA carboxylase beta subunit
VATEEELGGAEMHTTVSGLGEYLAEDDRDALGMAREVVARTGWQDLAAAARSAQAAALRRRGTAGLMPAHHREPVDMREVIARHGGRLRLAGIQGRCTAAPRSACRPH